MPTHTAVPMKKNYIKFPVRDFVSPLDAAWSILKNDNPNENLSDMYEELPDEAFMRRDKREQMRRQAALKEQKAALKREAAINHILNQMQGELVAGHMPPGHAFNRMPTREELDEEFSSRPDIMNEWLSSGQVPEEAFKPLIELGDEEQWAS